MLTAIHPKLPMRDKAATKAFYINGLGFRDIGATDYPDYLLLEKDGLQIHFFAHKTLDPLQNYGQIYIRTNDIDTLYQHALDARLRFPAGEQLQNKPWGQREFSLLDPDHNLLTFGQAL
ncbi:bleomycin resistance protein [Taibaiella koreensis]|uniref:bleomycin resistance protein n=1 Tax=Taibaiella koreensis TaxID=1268548 RepID=UPI000E5A069B|nr:VOC family protein [Taibaiella koreensis]